MNIQKIEGRSIRVVFFLVAVLMIWHDRSYPWFQCYMISYYFAACDDLPPSMSKIKQWVSLMRVGRSVAVTAEN